MIADAAAALVGRRFGRHRWPGSTHTVEGSLAFTATGLAVVATVPSLAFSLPAFGVAALGVVVAAAAEAAPLPLNDNIRVPLTAALVVTTAQVVLLGHAVSWGIFGTLP
jgi:dolichol kinase